MQQAAPSDRQGHGMLVLASRMRRGAPLAAVLAPQLDGTLGSTRCEHLHLLTLGHGACGRFWIAGIAGPRAKVPGARRRRRHLRRAAAPLT